MSPVITIIQIGSFLPKNKYCICNPYLLPTSLQVYFLLNAKVFVAVGQIINRWLKNGRLLKLSCFTL